MASRCGISWIFAAFSRRLIRQTSKNLHNWLSSLPSRDFKPRRAAEPGCQADATPLATSREPEEKVSMSQRSRQEPRRRLFRLRHRRRGEEIRRLGGALRHRDGDARLPPPEYLPRDADAPPAARRGPGPRRGRRHRPARRMDGHRRLHATRRRSTSPKACSRWRATRTSTRSSTSRRSARSCRSRTTPSPRSSPPASSRSAMSARKASTS